jgi:hypothetical protein
MVMRERVAYLRDHSQVLAHGGAKSTQREAEINSDAECPKRAVWGKELVRHSSASQLTTKSRA